MAQLPPESVASKLLAGRFEHAGSSVAELSDPIADTPMVVTLDQLRPYDLNPRVTRNPLYDDLKASILHRGLDSPPPITRRPGERYFIIRNGGNTRLSILNELWAETKDERFFRLKCLFRPWSSEIALLTGHLAENELHGQLTFIERALGVEKARELYEKEAGQPLGQRELARRLTADGYPVPQSRISRMQEAVAYLLPAIPSVLYAGLGRPQIERLIALRRAAQRAWSQYEQRQSSQTDFPSLWQDVLATFDRADLAFSFERVRDELTGQMATLLSTDYETVALALLEAETGQQRPSQPLPAFVPQSPQPTQAPLEISPQSTLMPTAVPSKSHEQVASPRQGQLPPEGEESSRSRSVTRRESAHPMEPAAPAIKPDPWENRLQGNIVSSADTTDRLQAIQRTIAEATGETVPDFHTNVLRAIPVQAGGLHPISDVWFIEGALDTPERLRTLLAQLAREIAEEANLGQCIESTEDGVGFFCTLPGSAHRQAAPTFMERAVLSLLNALSAAYLTRRSPVDSVRLGDDLAPLLQGISHSRQLSAASARLSDSGIVKLFRVLRLARRLIELESSARANSTCTPSD